MKPSVPSPPARIVKRAEVNAGSALPAASGEAVPMHAAASPETPPPRRVVKQARLLPGGPATSAVEVRCSCGEWTRIELRTADIGRTEERR